MSYLGLIDFYRHLHITVVRQGLLQYTVLTLLSVYVWLRHPIDASLIECSG